MRLLVSCALQAFLVTVREGPTKEQYAGIPSSGFLPDTLQDLACHVCSPQANVQIGEHHPGLYTLPVGAIWNMGVQVNARPQRLLATFVIIMLCS